VCKPGQARRLTLDDREEPVALRRFLLRTLLEHLDRARDRRERCSKLMGGFRNELPLSALPAHLLGDVGDHNDTRI
jgi:hypothetical protein